MFQISRTMISQLKALIPPLIIVLVGPTTCFIYLFFPFLFASNPHPYHIHIPTSPTNVRMGLHALIIFTWLCCVLLFTLFIIIIIIIINLIICYRWIMLTCKSFFIYFFLGGQKSYYIIIIFWLY